MRNTLIVMLAAVMAVLGFAGGLAAQSTPALGGPGIVGSRPGTPFLQAVGALNVGSGAAFSATGLPSGLTLDPSSGIISGTTPVAGTYTVNITASGSSGTAHGAVTIVSGNTLALTPMMGWDSWNSSYQNAPTEAIVDAQARALVATGMRDVGYQYVIIDDHWAQNQRDANGNLQPITAQFPDGIAAVANYVHSLGLKLGVYTDSGPQMFSGAPGSYNHEAQDAATFAAWGADYVKEDCNAYYSFGWSDTGPNVAANTATAQSLYTKMGSALATSGRSIVLDVADPGHYAPWTWAKQTGAQSCWTQQNLADGWQFQGSPPATLDRFAYPQGVLDAVNLTAAAPGIQAASAPGFWTAPDGLMAGVDGAGTSTAGGQATGLNYTQEKTQVSFWALWSTPLTTYVDLRKLNPSDPNYNAGYAANILPILTNAEVIAVDQDSGGHGATQISYTASQQVWKKQLANGSIVVALLNSSTAAESITADWASLGLTGNYTVRDLWAHQDLGNFSGSYTALVDSDGTALLELTAITPVPEPSVWVLLVVGAAALSSWRWRRNVTRNRSPDSLGR